MNTYYPDRTISIYMFGELTMPIVRKHNLFAFKSQEYSNIFNTELLIHIPGDKTNQWIDSSHMVLYGHRSIVNQTRYNPQKCLIASSGVEKVIKLWQPFDSAGWTGSLCEEANGSENQREVFTHEEYISLQTEVGAGGQNSTYNMTHDYSNQNTTEDPRMMAFFDNLVQQEIEGWNSNASMDSDIRSFHSSDSSSRPTSTQQSDSDSNRSYNVVPNGMKK